MSQNVDEFIETSKRFLHFRLVSNDPEGAKHVMSIIRALIRNNTTENYALSLLDAEFRSFNKLEKYASKKARFTVASGFPGPVGLGVGA